MKTKQTHTPTPVKIVSHGCNHSCDIYSGKRPFCTTNVMGDDRIETETNEANAEFIVKAVNSHDELVEALDELQFMVYRHTQGEEISAEEFNLARQQAKQALEKAERG